MESESNEVEVSSLAIHVHVLEYVGTMIVGKHCSCWKCVGNVFQMMQKII